MTVILPYHMAYSQKPYYTIKRPIRNNYGKNSTGWVIIVHSAEASKVCAI